MARRQLEGDGRRARIGIVVPSVNTVMEPWAQKVVPEGVSIFAARMFIPPATTPEAFIEMDRNEGKAAIRQLSSVFPDAIAYGCTASSIVQGWPMTPVCAPRSSSTTRRLDHRRHMPS
jgi:maleate isomerase